MQEIVIPDVRGDRREFGHRFRGALAHRADAGAVPYGYTVLTAATAGVLIDTHGPPSSTAAALFMAGAILAFTLVALCGSGEGEPGRESRAASVGAGSGVAAAAAFGVSAPIAHAVGGSVAFGLVAAVATTVYLGVGAAVGAGINRRGPEGTRSH